MSNIHGALAKLASYRAKNTRESQQTFEKGLLVLKSGKPSGLGDEGTVFEPTTRQRVSNCLLVVEWSFYEQLVLSALDIGRIDIADVRLQPFMLIGRI